MLGPHTTSMMRQPRSTEPSTKTKGAGTAAPLAIVLVVLLAALATTAVPGGAQAELSEARRREILDATLERAPRSPASPDDPFEALRIARTERDEAALARMDATYRSDMANIHAFNAALAQNTAQASFNDAVARQALATTELDVERDRLSELTVRAYVSGGQVGMDEYQAYVSGDTTDVEGGRQLMFSQVLDRQKVVTDQASRGLEKAKKVRKDARAVLDLTIAFANEKSLEAQNLGALRREAEARHERSVAAVATAQSRLSGAGGRGFGLVPEAVALIGIPRLNADDLAGWFRRQTYRPRISTPIEDFAQWFIDEGQAEGIRGDIAFAQAVLETGGFANDDSVYANNYSGIGHCDTCASGWRFPSPQMGVRAQIQLLKSYAIGSPTYVHNKVDSRLRGPAGCCPTWGGLTTVWATDPTYGPKVMLIYSDIVAYALSRRAAGQGFDDPREPLPLPSA